MKTLYAFDTFSCAYSASRSSYRAFVLNFILFSSEHISLPLHSNVSKEGQSDSVNVSTDASYDVAVLTFRFDSCCV